jgi:hypothetical protein
MNKTQVKFLSSVGVLVVLIASFFIAPKIFALRGDGAKQLASALGSNATTTTENEVLEKGVKHLPTPEPLKAIYMSSCVVGTKDFRASLVKIADTTEVNAIVIDVKDFSGTLSYEPTDPSLKHAWDSAKCGARDMREFIQELHSKNIYAIARVTVFQDPHFTKLHPELAVKSVATGLPWKDRKGLSFLDVGGKGTWDYTIAIARDASSIGFDEINFDYIRFPSDGNMKDAKYTLSSGSKADQLEKFFKYLSAEMKKSNIVTSADLFGMTTTNNDDLNIGQVLERTLPYFDYVAPMVYPSHYPPNFNGWKNPNTVPYQLIHFVMGRGVERAEATSTAVATLDNTKIDLGTSSKKVLYTHEPQNKLKLRTWIQDFDYGGNYDVAEVKAQIKATYDVGLTSWMIWAPSNKYTTGALIKD